MAIRHKIRKDGFGNTKVVKLTARRAIIENCKECLGFKAAEVINCTSPLCALYPFRRRGTPESITKAIL